MINYGMITPIGDQKVDEIVQFALKYNLGWQEVMPMLRNLANSEIRYGEAMDTVVREAVYEALMLTSDFYI
jgi:hypothetical protein